MRWIEVSHKSLEETWVIKGSASSVWTQMSSRAHHSTPSSKFKFDLPKEAWMTFIFLVRVEWTDKRWGLLPAWNRWLGSNNELGAPMRPKAFNWTNDIWSFDWTLSDSGSDSTWDSKSSDAEGHSNSWAPKCIIANDSFAGKWSGIPYKECKVSGTIDEGEGRLGSSHLSPFSSPDTNSSIAHM